MNPLADNACWWLSHHHRSAFLTSDRQALMFRRTVSPPRVGERDKWLSLGRIRGERRAFIPTVGYQGVPWTYLISPSFDRILREFPGSAVVELPAQQLCITVGSFPTSIASAITSRAPMAGGSRNHAGVAER